MILMKRQTNGSDHNVVKVNASAEDVQAEAMRLQQQFGYEVSIDGQSATCKLSHPAYRGEFLLRLEPDNSEAA